MAAGGLGHCCRIRVNPSTILARQRSRLSPFEGVETVFATGLLPRIAEKRKLVPPASRVMTMRGSSLVFIGVVSASVQGTPLLKRLSLAAAAAQARRVSGRP